MSTFDGVVSEFPRIRIDFFRLSPSHPPPLACFLSHIHSDHLQGLEALKAPFVYCSPATRRLLLRLEKYPHRINFLKGILESRKQHYRHLRLVLKAIPLECPTEIELGPLQKIRVTLFDANHCPGAVMFLIEGDNKAVLYTGDIRSELWWVNSLARNPLLLPYTAGLKHLDRMYLDTTFAAKEEIYGKFPSKAEGIRELLAQAQQYPSETLFYLNAWTVGYEAVWVALSTFLGTSVHIDSYQLRLYNSLSKADDKIIFDEYSALNGFYVGNHYKPGCLTTESTARIHSCEPGTPCHTELLRSERVVWVTPIISCSEDGVVVPELGAGGGGRDLHPTPELELGNISSISELEQLCQQVVQEPSDVKRLVAKIELARSSKERKMSLEGLNFKAGEQTFQKLAQCLLAGDKSAPTSRAPDGMSTDSDQLKNTILFPYSRHSSYNELCDLVAAFKPRDIYPCTVNEQTWTEEVSMEALFGHLCSGSAFDHDAEMRLVLHQRLENKGPPGKEQNSNHTDDKQTGGSLESSSQEYLTAVGSETHIQAQVANMNFRKGGDRGIVNEVEASDKHPSLAPNLPAIKAAYESRMARSVVDNWCSVLSDNVVEEREAHKRATVNHVFDSPQQLGDPQAGLRLDGTCDDAFSMSIERSSLSTAGDLHVSGGRRTFLEQAYRAAKLALQTSDSGAWDDLGIRCTGNNGHCEPEIEL